MVKDDVKAILIHTNGKVVIMADTNQNAAPQLSGTVLNFPEIVKRILSCLPAKVLCENVSPVCKLWRQQANLVLRHRRQYQWHLFRTKDGIDFTECWKNIKTFITDLPIRSHHAIVFCTNKLWKKKISVSEIEKKNVKGKRDKVDFRTALHRILPSKCRLICLVTDAIIGTRTTSVHVTGTSSDLAETKELDNTEAVSILFIGDYQGLDIKSFNLSTNVVEDLEGYWQNHKLSKAVPSELVPDCPHLKALILCCDQPCDTTIGSVLFEHLHRPLIVGGFVNALSVEAIPEIDSSQTFLNCLGFCGQDLQVTSVIFPPDVNTVKEAEKIILNLKEKSSGLSLERSIAFMFACVARGEHCYQEVDVESSVFRKHFPLTPVFGVFGNGEIGYEYPREGEKARPPKLFHSYTTVLSLICLP